VILEHSFHTNERAAKWLMSDENLTALAEAEAAALAEFYEKEKKEAMTEADKKMVDDLRKRLEKVEGMVGVIDPKYDWTLACPEWAQETIHKLHQKGYIRGDETGQLNLSENMCRLLVILDRAGAFES
jgi:hypothetical protein